MDTSAQHAGRQRVVIVTGASSGIGRSVAVKLASRGMMVVIVARRAAALDQVAAEIAGTGGLAVPVAADVTDRDDIDRIVDRAMSYNGHVDALVNVAGIGHGHSIMTDDAHAEQMIATNLLAPIRLMKAVAPILVRQHAGSIVNIGSLAGEIGYGGIYSATKFGLRGLTDSVRRELRSSGVAVTLIEPGYIATAMTASRPGRMPGPEIVARAVDRALRHPRRRVFVPAGYRIEALLSAMFPWIADRRIGRQLDARELTAARPFAHTGAR